MSREDYVTLSLLDGVYTKEDRKSSIPESTSSTSSQVGPRLWLSFWATIVGCPFVYGWNLGVTNLPGKYVKCWIQDTINLQNSLTDNYAQIYSHESSNSQNYTQTNTNFTNVNTYSPLNCSKAADYVNDELIFKDAEKIWAFTVGIFGIGAVIGALFGGQFADKFGRKNTMKWNTTLSVVACLLQFFSRIVGRVELLILGRVLIGISSGIIATVSPIYLKEISTPKLSGFFLSSYEMGNNFGILIGQFIGLPWLLGTAESWHILFGLGAVPPIIQLILLNWCPESPEYLHKNGDPDAAQESSFQLYGVERNYEKEEINVIKSVTCLDAAKSDGFKRGVTIVVMLQIIGQATGSVAIFLYSTKILDSIGFDPEYSAIGTVVFSVCGFIVTPVASFFLDEYGRVTATVWSLLSMSVCLLFGFLFLLKPFGLNLELLLLPAVGMYMIVYEVGIGPIRWMVASEMFPIQFRGISNAISSSTLLTCIFIVGFVFPTIQDLLGKYVFLLFGVVSFFSAIYVKIRVPETNGRSPEQVMDELDRRRFLL